VQWNLEQTYMGHGPRLDKVEKKVRFCTCVLECFSQKKNCVLELNVSEQVSLDDENIISHFEMNSNIFRMVYSLFFWVRYAFKIENHRAYCFVAFELLAVAAEVENAL
jgi:hypothetical protein